MFSPRLVHEYLSLSARRFPEKTALVCGEERLSYAEVDRASDAMARTLMAMGVARHDRVAVFMDNTAEAVVSVYGILKAGAAFVMLNGTMKARKLSYILKDSGARAVVSHTSKSAQLKEALQGLGSPVKTVWAGKASGAAESLFPGALGWEKAVGASGPGNGALPLPRCLDADLATLIYTSGSTGEPKGVVSTHANVVCAAQSIVSYLENRADDTVICVLPLSFDYGLYQVIMAFMYGGTVVLERSFSYPVRILETVQREKVTGFPIVPTIVAFMLGQRNLEKYDFSSLRYMTNTGAALPVEHIQQLRRRLPHVRIYSMFGLTECKRVCYLPPEEIDRRPSSVGVPMSCCEVFVVDENGDEVPPGTEGELVVRGGNVMRGYWNAPELTARVYRPGKIPGETWLYSGDVFRRDEEGFLYFVGRKDDLIKTRGERVGPKEVEYALVEIEGIAEAAVIGVPDEVMGQAIKAFLVRREGAAVTEKDVLRQCTVRLEPFMVPKYVEFVEELPKTPNGKIDKKALKAAYLSA
jgi:long-chain acyl-CoA synthetase